MNRLNTLREAGVTRQEGTVSAVDEVTGRVRVRIPELGNLRTDWLPVLQRKTQDDKDYWMPDIGEQVALLLDSTGDDGWVLGAMYSATDVPPVASRDKWHRRFKDRAMIEYDRAEHAFLLELPEGGTVRLVAPAGVRVVAEEVTIDALQTTCTGNLTVIGHLSFLNGMSGKSGKGGTSGGPAARLEGDVRIDGDVDATGTIMDARGNSNNHSHDY